MMTVLSCIVVEHDLYLVTVAGLLCILGSWVTARLYQRALVASDMQRVAWQFLTAMTAGVAIWCTHFVAMLGYHAGVPVTLDPVLTTVSLLIAVIGSTAGFILSGLRRSRISAEIGGAVVGLSVAAMHYTGMIAYRVDGIVSWRPGFLAGSIIAAVALSTLALSLGVRARHHARDKMAATLALAILALHFTGMAAFVVQPLDLSGAITNPEAFRVLGLAVAGMAILIVVTGLVSYLIDDQTRQETVASLERMALTDTLTGLPNRASFDRRLEDELQAAASSGDRFALVGIDLNRFKEINDVHGHAAGDRVLRTVGERCRTVLADGADGFAARIGGDEFSLILRLATRADIEAVLKDIEGALAAPIPYMGVKLATGASFGVAIYPDDGADSARLISNADLAMYRAKSDGIHNICFFNNEMDKLARARRMLSVALRDAVALGQIHVVYQAQSSIEGGETLGYEALARWRHPQFGQIPPSEFIPLAEENGTIHALGEWVLRRACMDAVHWAQPCKVAVNLSPLQFLNPDLPARIAEVLAETDLPAGRLELELTESAVFADKARALDALRNIRSLGVSIALDDFGNGYSSLDTLLNFPFDKVKIDRAILREALSNPQASSIVKAAVALGKSLGLSVLAEGVETEDQLALLRETGCDLGQGFHFGRPSSNAELFAAAEAAPQDTPRRRASGKYPEVC